MAANLAGMMQQLNQSITGSNAVDNIGGLLDQVSQSAGGMLGSATDVDPMAFMNQGAKEMESTKIASQAIKSADPDSMLKAAEALMAAGKTSEAQSMAARAKDLKQQQVASLEAMGEQNKVAALEAKKVAQVAQTATMARRNGDLEEAKFIESGILTPEVYAAKKMEEDELYKLSKGGMLVDKDGNVLRYNPDDAANGATKHAADKKEWDRLTTEALMQSSAAAQAGRLSQDIGAMKDWNTGAYSDFYGWYADKTGQRGKEEFLKTQFDSIRVADGIQKLPKGPASDKDIALVMGTVPGKNASQTEIMEYLGAVERTNARLAEYNSMRKQYVITNNREGFDQAWDTHKNKVEVREYREAAAANGSMAAAQTVNPATGKSPEDLLKDGTVTLEQFMNRYKYKPENY